MCEFEYRVRDLDISLTVEGHCGAGDYGHDLVCAAVSAAVRILDQGLTAAVIDDKVCDYYPSIEEGSANLWVRARGAYMEEIRFLTDSVAGFLKRLAAEYPEHVRDRETEGL